MIEVHINMELTRNEWQKALMEEGKQQIVKKGETRLEDQTIRKLDWSKFITIAYNIVTQA